MSTELVIQGIEAGMVPVDALVCELGGSSWKPLDNVPAFSIAIDERSGKRRFDPVSEQTIADPPRNGDALTRFDDVVEHTVAERVSSRLSEPPPRPALERFGETDERTIVEEAHFRPSDPPSEA